MGSAPIKRTVIRRAHCDEVVEIQWTFNNGYVFIERHTCPPKHVREARIRENEDKMNDDYLRDIYTRNAAAELKDPDR